MVTFVSILGIALWVASMVNMIAAVVTKDKHSELSFLLWSILLLITAVQTGV